MDSNEKNIDNSADGQGEFEEPEACHGEKPHRKVVMDPMSAVPGSQPPKYGVAKVWDKAVQGVSYSAALGAAAASSIILFRILNRTRVHGLENIPEGHENVLYCLNHNSLLDNFAFEAAAYVPKIIFKKKYLPISLADRKNFFGDPSSRRLKDRVLHLLGRHFFRHLKAYPVDRRTANMVQVEQWKELLKDNIVIVFPEGTRTRTGEIGKGKPGVGKLIYEARPIVVPVHMFGTENVLGVGMNFPAVFNTIDITIGKPKDMSEYLSRPLPEDRRDQMRFYTEISDAVLDDIRVMREEMLAKVKAKEVRRRKKRPLWFFRRRKARTARKTDTEDRGLY